MDDRTRVEGRVGPARLTDSQEAPLRMGNSGELITQELNGRYYEQALRGNVYIMSTAAAGIALITTATTGNHPSIWNPAGSGVNFIPIRMTLGYISGNNAPGSLGFYYTLSAGSAIGTAAPVVTWTNVAPVNALIGSSKASLTRWAPAVNTYVAAPTWFMTNGISLFTGVATTAVAPFSLNYEFDGTMVIGPGTVVSLCSLQATTTSLFTVTIIGVELPVPALAT
jgi:hypothetical protein